ncbi:hypothetical protein CU102_24190 [Phyllobacterium brassicacearum]|uniref:DUF4189 domain-containing protein n=1 Tax=Phyllobacterium brassicacearum TaxID=314235 RepID=A0A2P7BA73_9HYPH|nr:hypothetical protein [Phyllobacterium brassicacearum]PSH63363.1 hypothetical protein CU102_24190 [Phyllobacterium brassicacearum]TDQ07898.1 hypothetical protein DEV91_1659 [Phyllobacterium brassicacearum]
MFHTGRAKSAFLTVALSLTIISALVPTPVRAANNVCEYQDYDWAELSSVEKGAWGALGYSQRLWDGNGESSTSDKDWSELTSAEKRAAQSLGYTRSSWESGRC